MSDETRNLTVTGRQIAEALKGLRILVRAESAAGGMGTSQAFATVVEPGAVAASILNRVPGFGEPGPQPVDVRDSELRAMAVIAGELTGLDNPDAVSRILRYLCDRYGDGDE